MTDTDFVEVLLVQHGERTVTLAKDDLHAALGDPEDELLSQLLTDEADAVDISSVAVLPDGTVVDLFRALVRKRPALRSDRVTAAVAAVIAAAHPAADCDGCIDTVCPQHVAEALLTACRQERLVILVEEEADQLART